MPGSCSLSWNGFCAALLLPCPGAKPSRRVNPRVGTEVMAEEERSDERAPVCRGLRAEAQHSWPVSSDHAPETMMTIGRPGMGSLLRLLMLLLLATTTCTYAAELRPGDQVRFVERDQHIPAHP